MRRTRSRRTAGPRYRERCGDERHRDRDRDPFPPVDDVDALGRDKVRVNQINPGWVLSENEYRLKIKEGLPPDWPDHPPLEFAPSGKLMTPQIMAAACIYWISDESRPVSGSVLEINQYPMIGRNPAKR